LSHSASPSSGPSEKQLSACVEGRTTETGGSTYGGEGKNKA
jgi:hypothetical protein